MQETTLKDTFNSNFYMMTATVIPVLYLALILQAPMMAIVLAYLKEINDRLIRRNDFLAALLFWPTYYGTMFLGIGGLALLYMGVGSEVVSILALFHESDNYSNRQFVLFSTIILLVVTVATPLSTIIRAWTPALLIGSASEATEKETREVEALKVKDNE
jgi:hypothetical protein